MKEERKEKNDGVDEKTTISFKLISLGTERSR